MNETNISSMSPVDKKIEPSIVLQPTNKPSSTSVQEKKGLEKTEVKQPVASSQTVNPLKDVELKFVRDSETNQMTVFVVDKASKSVLRSIPADELEKMNAGDLLEISA